MREPARRRWPDDGPRIVAMTANVSPEDRRACTAAGMDDFLPKPLSGEALKTILERI